MQFHQLQITAIAYINKLGVIVLGGDNIKVINLEKQNKQYEIKTEKFLKIFQLIFNDQDNNLYQFNDNKTIQEYKLKGRIFKLDKQFKLEYDFFPTLAKVTDDNQTIIIAGIDSNLIALYSMANQYLCKIELPNPELQNYCLIYNRKSRCILTQSCLINVENKKVIRSVNNFFQKIKGWTQCGLFYSRQIKQKILITSTFKQKIIRIITNSDYDSNQTFSQTGKYYCFFNSNDRIELYDISSGIGHYIIDKNLSYCKDFQFHENDQVFSTIVHNRSIYIWNVNQIICEKSKS